MGIQSLRGKITKDIWETKQSKKLPKDLWKRARFLLILINSSTRLENLKIKGSPPDVRLHKLSGDRKGQWSISLSKTSGWRIAFKFKNGDFFDVEIVNYHRG